MAEWESQPHDDCGAGMHDNPIRQGLRPQSAGLAGEQKSGPHRAYDRPWLARSRGSHSLQFLKCAFLRSSQFENSEESQATVPTTHRSGNFASSRPIVRTYPRRSKRQLASFAVFPKSPFPLKRRETLADRPKRQSPDRALVTLSSCVADDAGGGRRRRGWGRSGMVTPAMTSRDAPDDLQAGTWGAWPRNHPVRSRSSRRSRGVSATRKDQSPAASIFEYDRLVEFSINTASPNSPRSYGHG